ncbi:unnamed protein product [Orchesella dallaii]|uniref:glutathione transferase n=1 Tax=Orchesella dallaii TaxID=48710 RepID=A0ABP1QS90_9HEXA
MSSSKPQLVYWDIRALAEPIRLLLRYLQVDFEDKRISFGDTSSIPSVLTPWFIQKYSHGLDFPNLPFYIDGDVRISQSFAILQYIARKYNLYGDTIEEQATIDMVSQVVNDLRWAAWVTYNDPNFRQIKDEWKTSVPERLGDLNKFLEGKEFVLGTKISFADFLVYESLEWYRQCIPEVFEQPELANLENFQKRIAEIPQIKEYLNSDNFKSWPFFAPIVNFGFSKDEDFKALPFSYRNFVAKYPLDPQ